MAIASTIARLEERSERPPRLLPFTATPIRITVIPTAITVTSIRH